MREAERVLINSADPEYKCLPPKRSRQRGSNHAITFYPRVSGTNDSRLTLDGGPF